MNTFRSFNPAHPEETVAVVHAATTAEVSDAVRRAADAQRAWAGLPVPARGEAIAAVAAILTERKSMLAQLITREAGKVLIEAGGDVQEAIDMAAFVAGQARNAWGTVHPCEMPNKFGFTTRHPVGVVGLITPWNFPVAIPSWKIFPALLAGNGVVIKPSELAPQCCIEFVDACESAGIPSGLVNVVNGGGEVGHALTVHPLVRAMSFTGSVTTGRKVATAAMQVGPKLLSLELGGKNAMIVMEDADLELVVEGALFGAFGTAGQRCTSTSRLVAHHDIVDELVGRIADRVRELVVGDPNDAATDIGPVINHDALSRIESMVRTAQAEGNTIAVGGSAVDVVGCDGGTFFEPTILRDATRDSFISRNEVFGPVLAVIEVQSFDEAIDTVNDCDYGLSSSIYTADINRAMHAVHELDTGIVYVNAPTIGAEIHLPFGGTKFTGNGYREAGSRGLEQFSETKSVYIDYSGRLQRAQIDNREIPT